MAAFIHNEPTSLTVIQELGLPDAFYRAIESGLESSTEVFVMSLLLGLVLSVF